MGGDVACADWPFLFAFTTVAVQCPTRYVVFGVGDVDVAIGWVDVDAVGDFDVVLSAVGDEVVGE